jgi:ABC-type nickel/cobalt efflux system permease component RcnA
MDAKRTLGIVTTLLTLVLIPRIAMAHPMGNFSINHYTKIIVGPQTIRLDYIIDMAEIPTFQETQRRGITARADDPVLSNYLKEQAEALRHGLTILVNYQPLTLLAVTCQAIFPPGAGGLPTMKLGFVYQARLPGTRGASPQAIHYQDDNFPGRAGWKEIVAVDGPGARLLKTSVPAQDRSLELTNYPTDMLHSPPQVLQADLSFRGGVPTATRDQAGVGSLHSGWLATDGAAAESNLHLDANRQGTPRSAFTDLIKSNRLDLTFLLTAALIAAVLGGFHALEPGHGKTLVAAYLVGSHGKARHAVMLGGIVTTSHTISVYILGIITLYASQWIMPEQLYPWLGMASGSLVAGLGLTLFIRRYLAGGPPPHGDHLPDTHVHDSSAHHPHDHHHHDHDVVATQPHRHSWWGGHVRASASHAHADSRLHQHGQDSHQNGHLTAEALSLKSLFALGVTGGIVPCPAALVVLLGALAFHRIVFGLFLIVAFSAGLAFVLIFFGLAIVYAGRFVHRFAEGGPLIERWVPLASSAVITMVGIVLTLQSLVSAGLFRAGT